MLDTHQKQYMTIHLEITSDFLLLPFIDNNLGLYYKIDSLIVRVYG
jgi:hypothetical protein